MNKRATACGIVRKFQVPIRDARRSGYQSFQTVADEKATPVGSFALPLAEIRKVVGALRVLLQELIAGPGGAEAFTEQCEVALQKTNLKPEAIRQTS